MAILALGLRFLVELAGIAALAYWGLNVPLDPPLPALLGVGTPVALIIVWATVVAPNATNRLTQGRRRLIGTMLLVLASTALATVGQPAAAIVLGALVVVDSLWLVALGEAASLTRPTTVPAHR